VLFSGVMVALYCVPKAVSGDSGDTGIIRLGATNVPLDMSVGHEGVVVDVRVTAAVAVVVDCIFAVVVAADIAEVEDGRPRTAQLNPPVKSVILVQPVESAMLPEKMLKLPSLARPGLGHAK
jgi:hypothetical protein